MDNAFQLTMEQEFNIRSFSEQVKGLSREESQEFLVNLYRQMVMKEAMYKQFLAHEWGISAPRLS
jgi:hypothetical protein